ncbi:Ig-like domain-containing protein, partial [Paenibacillus popilliae]|uniref:Ig-like domain-containing protein n=1 Tax=Paenibacillus popilliae TaxID=78057 RepID=UPI0005A75753
TPALFGDNEDQLTLTFNGALDKTSAEANASYTFEKEDAQGTFKPETGITVTEAKYKDTEHTVELTINGLQPGGKYKVTATAVNDSGNQALTGIKEATFEVPQTSSSSSSSSSLSSGTGT